MLQTLAGKQIAAIDIGSGTVKLSVFSISKTLKIIPLELHEIDTQLRLGMGVEMTLKPKPVAASLNAAAALKRRAQEFDPVGLAVYATSAVRRAKNPEFLLEPLKDEIDLEAIVLSEAQEGRLNLLGAQLAASDKTLVACDPGGDSTDCAWGEDWTMAKFASLPFGSVALLEEFGPKDTAGTIPILSLEKTREAVTSRLRSMRGLEDFTGNNPVIRMNEAMWKALDSLSGLKDAQGKYAAQAAWTTAVALADMGHRQRAAALKGEPDGKVDRTPFGYASWAGMMDFFGSQWFKADPWGIKLGAPSAAALNLGPWGKGN